MSLFASWHHLLALDYFAPGELGAQEYIVHMKSMWYSVPMGEAVVVDRRTLAEYDYVN